MALIPYHSCGGRMLVDKDVTVYISRKGLVPMWRCETCGHQQLSEGEMPDIELREVIDANHS